MALIGESKRNYQRDYMRERRKAWQLRGKNHKQGVCEICGYSRTVDTHHEGETLEEHTLCPNCHGLITRGIKTLAELREEGLTNPGPNATHSSQGLTESHPGAPSGIEEGLSFKPQPKPVATRQQRRRNEPEG